ncbi:tonB-system energizer ExbB [Paracoccus aurantiacus]|uniref:Biopolymer transport protein ExbB n=1 Tax=Paracoccus aurantiacus TaxID=2599412 RepID=A0A5C6S9P0_9RHOB|nr:tonB-system energizer ExbB [Paracoccus aurantiacus]TXB71176.1 tonB-system energizer ExbB [Paracoccus aurantiacus]
MPQTAFHRVTFVACLAIFSLGGGLMAQTPPADSPAIAAPTPVADAADPDAAAQDAASPSAPDLNARPDAAGSDEAVPPSAEPSADNRRAALSGLAARLPHDLSPWGMFMNADIVVKAVMIGLAFASVVTWTVLVVKLLEIVAANRNASRSAELIARASSLSDAVAASGNRKDPASRMLRAAATELDRSTPALDRAGSAGLKERVTSYLRSIVSYSGRRAGVGTGILATIGSTAPFVGLFGTVWGIMNSFIGISESQTTNLAVVAPGIAEALLATALGLVAAIPAVVIYNFFARQISGYRLRLTEAAAGVERLLSRDLDFRTISGR